MIYPIYTELTQCRDCYKCVRGCPVKAIQVNEGSAVVLKDRCVFCGHCVGVCPTHAKKARNDLARVKQFLKEKQRVIAAIAPSFVAEFPGKEKQVLAALIQLGFVGVSETAIGAELVNAAVMKIAAAHGGSCSSIGTACPTVVQMVHKYYPEAVPRLLPVPSPLQCQAAYLRHLYGDDIGIVFIGPCIAKKLEADETPGYPDYALTYTELRQWLGERKIDLDKVAVDDVPPYMPAKAGGGSLYPVEGGMIASLPWGRDPFQTKGIALSGPGAVMGALGHIGKDEGAASGAFLELLACEGGCINGPGTAGGASAADRRGDVQVFARESVEGGKLFRVPDEFVDLLVREGYGILKPLGREKEEELVDVRPHLPTFSEAEISRALHELGKNAKSDELNCGGCGYNSCRDMAVAYLSGMAEPEMCVTKMRKEAQSKMDVLLRTIPMGVVIVDDELKIHDCNAGFLDLFAELGFTPDEQTLNMMKGLPLEQFVPFFEKFREQFDADGKTNQYRLHYQDKFLRVTFFTVSSQHLVGALFEDVTSPTVRRETVIKKAEDVIQKSLNTVQQIASLLGENAADTEIMLNSLIEAFKVPSTSQDDENGFAKDDQQDLT